LCQRWRGPSQTEHKPKPSSLLCPSGLPTALWQKSLLPGHWFSDVMDFCEPGRTYEHIFPQKKNLKPFWSSERSPGVDPRYPNFVRPLYSEPQGHWDYILRHSFLHKPWKARVLQMLQSRTKQWMTSCMMLYKCVYTYIHYITLHYNTIQYITLHCIALHYIALHYITLDTCHTNIIRVYIYMCVCTSPGNPPSPHPPLWWGLWWGMRCGMYVWMDGCMDVCMYVCRYVCK